MFMTAFLSVFLVCIPVSLAVDPVVSTTSGEVRGQHIALAKVNQFLGIPYAKQKRFQAPESYPTWTGIRNATAFGASCPQATEDTTQTFSEDCLFVNVYSPDNATVTSALDVMFWIHGGSYTSGSGNLYSGLLYAMTHNIVLVNINYRLGILGYFNIPGTDTKGNYGMLDQIMALKWVKDNIKNFGGDPKKVTVFGESAGSTSVSLLGMSPLTKGLFKQAIMESGSAVAHWAYAFPDEEAPKKLAKVLQCPETLKSDMLSCIMGKSVQDILTAQAGFFATSVVVPSVDQYFLKDSPRNLLETGDFHKMPVMMGTNVNENAMFLRYFQPFMSGPLKDGMSKLELENYIKTFQLKNAKESVKEATVFQYSDNECLQDDCPLTNRQLAVDIGSDLTFNAAVDFEARVRSQGAKVYSYLFSYVGTSLGIRLPSWVNITHASELQYVFGAPLLLVANYTNEDRKVSMMMMKSWANFAKFGDPNHGDLGVTWPRFVNNGSDGRSYLSIKLNPTVEQLYRPHKIAFWNSYIHNLMNTEVKNCIKDTPSSSCSVLHTDVILICLIWCASILAVFSGSMH